MTRSKFLTVLLTVWLAVFLWSFVFFWITPATGDSFTRGLNRISGFLGWQLVSIFLAFVIWRIGNGLEQNTALRRLRFAPLWSALGLIVAIAAVIGWTIFNASELQQDHTLPTTMPVTQ